MNLGITGATGLIGRKVIDLALRRGHEVVAFSRRPESSLPGCEMRLFAAGHPPDLTGCDAIVHLAGEPVVGLWTPAKKRRIRESRVTGTRLVAEAIRAMAQPPEAFLCGSAIGYYGDSGEVELSEAAPGGTGFLAEVVQAWEAEAIRVAAMTRVVLLRTSVVLAREGGALKVLRPLFRAGLGAQIGDGQQWMSWIHLEDLAQLVLFAVENMALRGPVNATAPWPVRNAEFTRTLARVLHRPAWWRAPRWALKLLGDFSHEVLDSKRVVPAMAAEHGFRFQFPEVEQTLLNLEGR